MVDSKLPRIIFAHEVYRGRSTRLQQHAASVVATLREIAGSGLEVVEGSQLGHLGLDCDLGLVLPLRRAADIVWAIDCQGLTGSAEPVRLLVYGLKDLDEYPWKTQQALDELFDAADQTGTPWEIEDRLRARTQS